LAVPSAVFADWSVLPAQQWLRHVAFVRPDEEIAFELKMIASGERVTYVGGLAPEEEVGEERRQIRIHHESNALQQRFLGCHTLQHNTTTKETAKVEVHMNYSGSDLEMMKKLNEFTCSARSLL
jgi:hypothetical protein